MPRDSSGTYTPSPASPFVTGTPIAATTANARAADLATEITDSLSRSGKGGMTAPLVFSGIAATIRSGIANSASAVGHVLDTVAALSTAGAKLLSLRTAGVEKFYVDKDGKLGSKTNLPGVGQQIASTSTGLFSTTSATYVDVTNATLSITTTGRPVMIFLQPDGTSNPALLSGFSTTPTSDVEFKLMRDSTDLSVLRVGALATGSTQIGASVPPGSMLFLDAPAAGTYTYKLQAKGAASDTASVYYCKLAAFEL
jgi:hypothetical protein